MRILVEEYNYNTGDVRDLLGGLVQVDEINPTMKVNYVGYYYNPSIQDCVFILPKVLMDEHDKVFWRIDPADLLKPEETLNRLSSEEHSFIYEFSVWIYQAIKVFNDSNPENEIVYKKLLLQTMGKRFSGRSHTFLDVLIAIQQFYRRNHDFFMYVLKDIHSGYNKVNWTKTVAHSKAVIEDESPVYLDLYNRRRQINYDEELFIIFFSILDYISRHYGFLVVQNIGFELIRGKKFDRYLNGYGKTRLRQIKYKYFSDKALQMWDLCYAFFDSNYQIRTNTNQREYLLVKNFNIVFEAIIDELIGDKDIPKGLKEQEDGKLVDHMYTYEDLITNDSTIPVYYIGDSKYYKRGNAVGRESVYKQFTYARNVIQWNLNLFMSGDNNDKDRMSDIQNFSLVGKLRDDDVEGYNIIPNFFISARLDKNFSYKEQIERTDKKTGCFINRQFDNRLFDRDTLLIFHYDVNFLYVVSLYARNNASQKIAWKEKVRRMFRTETQQLLQERFNFYAMSAHPDVNGRAYIKEHFQNVLGKIYTPYADKGIYSLALDKKFEDENNKLLVELGKSFFIEACRLGEDPQPKIAATVAATKPLPSAEAENDGVLMVMMESYEKKSPGFLPDGRVAVPIKYTKDSMRIVENLHSVGYILFHAWNDRSLHLFAVKGPCEIKTKEEVGNAYMTARTTDLYVFVTVNTSVELDPSAISIGGIPIPPNELRYNAQYSTIGVLTRSLD